MRRYFCALIAVMALLGAAAHAQTASGGGSAVLANVRIPQEVLANGQPLSQGTYEIRLTDEWIEPLGDDVQGRRWVEFYTNGHLAGREAALVIPAGQIDEISSWHPAPGASRVDLLKSGDFVRVWVNREGTNYLIHLPVPMAAAQP